ncbi:hypothetical protein KQX54_005143 [Cotesia glomerata]|uniref:Uncharacterized protein n=1 Tax=Cotesia glomerata TaxID=32391 RepID=A0AAV7HHW2_COTGL|nr:hypothetical protein KQX54_005143 [Cotesia glomerata]
MKNRGFVIPAIHRSTHVKSPASQYICVQIQAKFVYSDRVKAEEYFIVSYSPRRGGRVYLDGTLGWEEEGRYLRVEKPASFMFGVSRTLSSALYLGARQTVAKSHPLLEVVVRNLEEKEVGRLTGGLGN